MKRYLKNFTFSEEYVKERLYKCLDNKRWTRRDTSYFLAYYVRDILNKKGYKTDIHKLAKKVRLIALSDRSKLFSLVDYIAIKIYLEIRDRNISLPPIHYQIRKDKSNGKDREIGIASIKQQVYDYIIVGACEKMFLAKIGKYQCASLKGKGQIFGKESIERWIRKDTKHCTYVYKCDIKKYYPSVSKELIMKKLKRDIKNDTAIYILETLLNSYKQGLCIGSYLCQYLANYYLSYLYHYLDEKPCISHKLFYMDDLILFSPNKREFKKTIILLKEFLKELGLRVKENELLFKLDSRDIDMMGYKINRKVTTIRKRIFIRANRLYKSIRNEISLIQAYRCISYFGYFKHSNSFKYLRQNKIYKKIKKAKEKVSYETKNNFNARIASIYVSNFT